MSAVNFALRACAGAATLAGVGAAVRAAQDFRELRHRVRVLEKHKLHCDGYRRLAALERGILFDGSAPLEAARARRAAAAAAREKVAPVAPPGWMNP